MTDEARQSPAQTVSHARLAEELNEAERKAWDALGRYKFQMFGYWAAIWVHLNRIGDFKRPNPWKKLVLDARSSAPRKAPASCTCCRDGLDCQSVDVCIAVAGVTVGQLTTSHRPEGES